MRVKKKGSALLGVILIFGILIAVGSAVMSVSLSDVKLRGVESKRVQNLYGSESGLEKTYGILSTYVDDAIKEGNNKVEVYLNSLNGENGVLENEKQNIINDDKYKSDFIKTDGTINEEYIKNQISIKFKEGYKESFSRKIKERIEKNKGYLIGTELDSPRVKIKNLKVEDVVFTIPNNEKNKPEEMKFIMSSSYHETDINGLKNTREIESTFKVYVPEFDAPYSLQTEKVGLTENIIRGKTLVSDSNLELNNNSNLSVIGEAFVMGNSKIANESNGIILKGQNGILNLKNAKLISKGDTKILGAFSEINSDDKSTLFTGSLSIDEIARSSNIDIQGAVYANNDLVLNGEKSSINIKNGFYGVNDIRNTKISDNRKNSSSIIVNTNDIGKGSSINIDKELVLLGTAYIDTKPNSYQTGESVGVKGNYKAYTAALEAAGTFNKDNIIFDYLAPLQLANRFKDGKELTIKDKNDYFIAYCNNRQGSLNLSGINLPDNVFSLGVTIDEGKAKEGIYSIDNDTIRKNVAIYESKTNEIESIEQYINFSAIKSTESKVNDYADFKEILYLSNENKDLVISNGDGTTQTDKIFLNKKKAKGIIITAGNVYIDSNVNFEGTIISKGKVIVKDGAVATLASNKKVVDYIVAKNYDRFTGVFKNNSVNGTSNIEVEAAAVIASQLQSIPKENIIKTGNWRLVK